MNLRKLQQVKVKLEERQNISGKAILLTGRIPKYTRTTIEKKIIELGGYLQPKATANTDIVVYTRTDTTKYKSAKNMTYINKNMMFVTGDDFVQNYLKME